MGLRHASKSVSSGSWWGYHQPDRP
ncbi:MAG: cyclic lactone autoinducer peptide [Gammaproteobacteria bacterium]|nr:cyclic lactone autoinducer peptide [Gammaproteobacteria bacterium]NBT44843.1 cyclic lactone autoinducer peptide [Gammaproteobacteria bacterium]NBY23182.1 cyclic lactone autoinducer peptide [Gammaproteobacteria bacterium]NDE33797.1 cyclic lactone autoinducer peptide [Gammaproteobacteria bacterium]NDE55713.1 cyclic lactone autoinducer peptide [Gammaproteobacteria bacterium]